MGSSIRDWMRKVAKGSNDFETNNSDLKRKYLVRNIQAFNYIASLIDVNQGSFGTGYPFYVLKGDLSGELPIISEQIRYNDELVKYADNSQREEWICENCLTRNYQDMPDLKQICKPCPNMDDTLKPRKVINRLPDLDMWMICKDGCVEEAQRQLSMLLKKYDIHTSDVDPVQTIKDMNEITEDIKNGIMPKKFLPIDAHIIEYSKIKNLIAQVPEELQHAVENGKVPYLPIHPKSYRKTWQYDDEAYNFIYDFLSAFTPFNLTTSMDNLLRDVRASIATTYSDEELYTFLVNAATPANKRRNNTTKSLKKIFSEKVQSWRQRIKDDEEEQR